MTQGGLFYIHNMHMQNHCLSSVPISQEYTAKERQNILVYLLRPKLRQALH